MNLKLNKNEIIDKLPYDNQSFLLSLTKQKYSGYVTSQLKRIQGHNKYYFYNRVFEGIKESNCNKILIKSSSSSI
jgi:hypothetical protein